MLAFYLTRAMLLVFCLLIQNSYKLPYPEGIYWADQGVPSLGVPYGITRDFFYSGHTGFMVFSVGLWSTTRFKMMKYFMVAGLAQVIWLLLITRVHYTIDIVAGWIFSEWFSLIILSNLLHVDRFITTIIEGVVWVCTELSVKIEKNIRILFGDA